MGKKRDLTNQKFGRLLAIAPCDRSRTGQIIWLCQCDCGNTAKIYTHYLTTGHTKSCGCYSKELTIQRSTKHGYATRARKSKAYKIWDGIIERCTNPNSRAFKYYGGRGIEICERWRNNFENFLADMGEPPANCSIDRINNDGNYEPGNCRWATHKQQCRNQRSNLVVEAWGIKKTLAEWAELTNLKYSTIQARLSRGWQAEIALSYPLVRGNQNHDMQSKLQSFNIPKNPPFHIPEDCSEF